MAQSSRVEAVALEFGMISALLAAMLLAPPSPAAIATARREYSACLAEFMKQGIRERMEPDAFDAGLVPACAAKEAAFRSVVIAADVAAGIKRADAEGNAKFEIEDLQTNIRETFRDTVAPKT
jgi:hypothetical protein